MYAIIVTGGKQYRVKEGQTLKVEKIEADANTSFEFDKVLMLVDGDTHKMDASALKGCKVTGSIVRHGRHDKIRIIKMKRRKHHMKRAGHRQWYTEIKITGIKAA